MSVAQTSHQKTHGRTSPTGATHPFPSAAERPDRTEGTRTQHPRPLPLRIRTEPLVFVTPPIGASDGAAGLRHRPALHMYYSLDPAESTGS